MAMIPMEFEDEYISVKFVPSETLPKTISAGGVCYLTMNVQSGTSYDLSKYTMMGVLNFTANNAGFAFRNFFPGSSTASALQNCTNSTQTVTDQPYITCRYKKK